MKLGTQRDIAEAAEQYLSRFDGDPVDFTDEYLGFNDDFLEFEGGATSFANEVLTGRRFTVQLDNTQGGTSEAIAASTDKKVILIPSFDPKGGHVLQDGNNTVGAAHGGANQVVAVSGIPNTLVSLQKWIALNPVRCLGLKLETTNTLQMGKFLTVASRSPFRNLPDENIYIQDYKTENQYNEKVATIMRPFQMDNQTDVILELSKNSIVTVTFYFGAALNTAKALRSKSNVANNVLAVKQHRL